VAETVSRRALRRTLGLSAITTESLLCLLAHGRVRVEPPNSLYPTVGPCIPYSAAQSLEDLGYAAIVEMPLPGGCSAVVLWAHLTLTGSEVAEKLAAHE